MFATLANIRLEPGYVLRQILFAGCICILLIPCVANSAEIISCEAAKESADKLPFFNEDKREHINISADSTRASNEGNSVFEGNVVIEQHQRRIQTDHAEYSDALERVTLDGHVKIINPSLKLSAQSGLIDMASGSGEFEDVEFSVMRSGLRGHASTIKASKDDFSELQHSYITSCAPDDNSWRLDADKINLDHNQEYGFADDVVLRFKDVPFFYTPYIEFPLGNRRRSGLLIPAFGDSSSRGFEISIPWYWNIAPNHDAIIAPHFMNRRGTQLDTQYRFLTRSSEGQFDSAYLQNDEITGESRYQVRYQQHNDFTDKLTLDVDLQDVSDTAYFEDFSNDITGSSTTHLNRSADLVYAKSGWRAGLFAQTFETIDENILLENRPYRRLPQLRLDGTEKLGNSPLVFDFNSEWVAFDHEDDTLSTGARTTLKPQLSLPLQGVYWFAKPAVSLSFTDYQVEDGNGAALSLEQRTLTTSSVDAGLLFERPMNNGLVQTLEPRLFYLNVPYEDQDSLPLFDTSVPDFSIAQLFRDNRFNGGDRIGDANQLTLALSSRMLDPATGNEVLRASLGQIIYFDDRRVTLTGTDETTGSSDLIAELSASWLKWRSTASLQWDNDARRSEKQNFLLHYQSDEHYTKSTRIFNIGYRLRDDAAGSASNIEQSDVSFVTPINKDYALFGRWNYSIKDSRDIDTIGGLAYDSCCWSVQMLLQRRLNSNNATTEYDNSIMVQLVLKGLGSVSGNSASTTLSRAILGYSEE
ncbi:MAG: LPS assembly protein LptD [Gammaproteobacteria bacterium]